jgi:predicted transcriptional regulator
LRDFPHQQMCMETGILAEGLDGPWEHVRVSVASVPGPDYHQAVAKAKKFELEAPVPILDEEDEETLAAIDEGIRDADAGRTVPAKEVRQRLPKWITDSPTRKKR